MLRIYTISGFRSAKISGACGVVVAAVVVFVVVVAVVVVALVIAVAV